MAKKFLISALVLVSAYVAILMFFGNTGESQKNGKPVAVSDSTKEKPNSPLNSPLIEPLVFKTTGEISLSDASSSPAITQQDVESVINQYFDEGIKNFNTDDLRPVISLKDLKIISGSSKEAAQIYIENLNAIYSRDLENVDQAASYTSDIPDFNIMIAAYDKTIAALYELAVPENLAFIHRDQITLLSAQKNALNVAKNFEKDPLNTILAIQAAQEFNQEFASLQNTLIQVIE